MNKIAFTLYFWQLSAIDAAADKLAGTIKSRREAGQGTLEYVGMIAVAAIIISAVILALKKVDMGAIVDTAIAKITSAIG